MTEQIIDSIATAIKTKDAKKLLNNLISYSEKKKSTREHSLLQAGIPNLNQLQNFPSFDKESAMASIAKQYIEEAQRKGKKFAERKRLIKDALNVLAGLYEEKGDGLSAESFILIARTYYLLSITILPKGKTIPEKKKEALKKGRDFVERALNKLLLIEDNSSDNDTPFEEPLRIKSLLSLEYNRIDEDACDNKKLRETLEEAVKEGCNKWTKFEEDVRIAVRLCELGELGGFEAIFLENFEKIIASNKTNYLQRAKLCYFFGKDNDRIKKYMGKCIKQLKQIPFSHRLWEDATCFIRRLKEEGSSLWKDFALAAYKACRVQENETSGLRLRWYWSRQRDLYDLAFLAAKEKSDVRKMAEIGDSCKSRSSLRLSALEKMKLEWLKAYEAAYMESYIPNLGEVEEYEEGHESSPPEQVDLVNLPEGWLVVHFYLNQLEKKGYAIVYNKDADTWNYKDFKYDELFEAFLRWQVNYNLYKEEAAEHLVRLCKKIGKVMPFLFNEDFISAGKDILFIPHDFLHRLPLHGALCEDDNGYNKAVFLENHPCCYLPAWSFAAKDNNQDDGLHADKETKHKRILLKNFEEGKKVTYEEILPPEVTWDICKIPASCEDLKDVTSQALLVILCHGEADVSNPFNARLKLAQGGITHLEILQLGKKFQESLIILGACETDLVPPLGDILDEHISITTAFLTNGAPEILGTMWEAFDNKISDVVIKIRNKGHSSSMTKELGEWQKTGAENYRDNADISAFYKTVVFRVIGFCM